MGICRTFVCKEHAEYGLLGLVLKDHPSFDPLMGITVAHDMLEHYPDDMGELHQEFMALGATLVVRGEGGYFSNSMSSVLANIVSDITNIAYFSELHDKILLSGPSTVRPVAEFTQEDYNQAVVAHISSEQLEHIDMFDSPEKIEKFVIDSYRWICRGFAKAKDRYRGIGACQLSELFKMIEKQVDKKLTYMEEGQELVINASPKNFTVTLTVKELAYNENDGY